MDVRIRKLYTFFFIASLAGFSWLTYSLITYTHKSSGVCIFKSVTGIPCPSCGSTRSVISLISGDPMSAVRWNPFGFIIVVLMFVIPVLLAYDLVFNKTVLYNFYTKSESIIRRKIVAIPLIALVILNWIWNIIKHI